MNISNEYIFKGDYSAQPHKSLKLLQTNEEIVWIIDGDQVKFRCYGLPDTIHFCQTMLRIYNTQALNTMKLNNTRERLMYHHLHQFLEAYYMA